MASSNVSQRKLNLLTQARRTHTNRQRQTYGHGLKDRQVGHQAGGRAGRQASRQAGRQAGKRADRRAEETISMNNVHITIL